MSRKFTCKLSDYRSVDQNNLKKDLRTFRYDLEVCCPFTPVALSSTAVEEVYSLRFALSFLAPRSLIFTPLDGAVVIGGTRELSVTSQLLWLPDGCKMCPKTGLLF